MKKILYILLLITLPACGNKSEISKAVPFQVQKKDNLVHGKPIGGHNGKTMELARTIVTWLIDNSEAFIFLVGGMTVLSLTYFVQSQIAAARDITGARRINNSPTQPALPWSDNVLKQQLELTAMHEPE